ncbi:hypothetical protein DB30_07332 [Enhygromyxa salina]|uniref:MerC mercury resistance protein n=2 Tax=Enhygromyxa salina TaxID=215803 RepID=A0A0C2CWJ6_9BACT|nr:hypothetical protein DB30_07332 [Enhygromyxa salina]
MLSHEAEWTLTGVALLFAGVALVIGWRRHRSFAVALAFGLGICGLLLARYVEETGALGLGTTLAIVAGSTLVVGHLSNIRAARLCNPDRQA